MTRDYKLADLIPWFAREITFVRSFANPEIDRVFKAASNNIQRTDATVQTVAAAFYATQVAQRLVSSTSDKKTLIGSGLHAWQSAAGSSSPFSFGPAIDAALRSFVVQAWTTFEVLASDLWEAALNVHPKTLAELNGASDRSRDAGPRIALGVLSKYDYDVTNKMGSILKNELDCFGSLGGIRAAYRLAFSNDAADVLEPLDHEAFTVLWCVRELIVRRSSVVDERYEREAAASTLAPSGSRGEELLLDGKMLAELLSVGIMEVLKLFEAVDCWVATN